MKCNVTKEQVVEIYDKIKNFILSNNPDFKENELTKIFGFCYTTSLKEKKGFKK